MVLAKKSGFQKAPKFSGDLSSASEASIVTYSES
jgi:hypothetical protein